MAKAKNITTPPEDVHETLSVRDDAARRAPSDQAHREAAIADTIHGDRLSDAHILPHGNANAKRAQ